MTLVITVGAFFLMGFVSLRTAEIKLPEDINVVVVGNSQVAQSVNDSIIPHWQNLAHTGYRFNEIAPALDLLLSENNQIDTVVVGVSMPGMCRFPNITYMERGKEEIGCYILDILLDKNLIDLNLGNPSFLKVVLLNSPNVFVENRPSYLGAYDRYEMHKLANHHKFLAKDRYDRSNIYRFNKQEHSYQISGLLRILDICRYHGVQAILMDSPQDNSNQYFDTTGYYWEFLSTLDPDMPIADYYRFQFPDTSYYGDVTHLNYNGARYLSEHIRDHGLQTVPLSDYIRRRGEAADNLQ